MSEKFIVQFIKLFLLLAFGFAVLPPTKVFARQSNANKGSLRPELDSMMTHLTQEGYSGSVLIARNGKIILEKGYGLADREQNIPNTSDTLFNVASVSKVFTAAAILQLEEKGKLKTSDYISKYLGNFPKEKNEATIHHLLTHTSGLVVKGASLDYSSRKAFIQSVKETPMATKPGEKYQYLNAGYSLLAAVVEEASGLTFEEYLRRFIFKPARMKTTGYIWDARFNNASVAVGYRGKKLEELKPEPPETDVWASRGPEGLLTTVGDLYKWIKALEKNKILSKAAKKKMFIAYTDEDEGYGWHVNRTEERGMVVNRGGGLPAFESELRWYVDENVVVIFTINNHLGFRTPIIKGIEQIIWKQ
jgi:CubicO group peptidase (beta-lactamase class C family)